MRTLKELLTIISNNLEKNNGKGFSCIYSEIINGMFSIDEKAFLLNFFEKYYIININWKSYTKSLSCQTHVINSIIKSLP